MKKNTAFGLAILAVMIIVAVLLWRHYLGGPPGVGPGPVATSKAPVAPAPAVPPTAAPPIKVEPSPGIAPLQEPGPPGTHLTIPPPPAMKEHYGILVGSFKNYEDAAKLLGTLKKQGKPAFVQRDPKNLNLFQAWLGPFSSQDEAQAEAKEMQAKFKKPLKIEQIENPVPK
ncbi:MAG: SPOR domain-containing protein [Desulfobaccales bacterium]